MDKLMSSLYAPAPVTVRPLEDCYFYHTIDIPGHGRMVGEWDLTRDTDAYLGHTDFRGKRVLEVGPASGYLSFEMERKGASVVSVDVSDEFEFDVVPFESMRSAGLSDGFVGAQKKVQNGYWLCHKAFNSKNKVHYGSGYKIPAEFGQFEVGLLASVLLHNANPIAIINQVARLTTEKLIIVDLFHDNSEKTGLPTIQFYPSVENQTWHTWWRFSEAFFVEVLKIVGFKKITVNHHTQYYRGQAFALHTVVGER
jgi:SAM-dependent methyltransferase